MKKVILILLSAGFLISCDSTAGTQPEKVEQGPAFENLNLIPLEVGNYWVHEDFMGEYDTTFIQKDTTINGEKFYKETQPLYYSDGEFYGTSDKYYAYRDSGLVVYDHDSDGDISLYMFYRFPEIGAKYHLWYEQKGRNSDRFDWKTDLLSTDSTLTTDIGTFECYVYHSYQYDKWNNDRLVFQERLFFAEGVGIVKKSRQHSYYTSDDIIEAHIGNNPELP